MNYYLKTLLTVLGSSLMKHWHLVTLLDVQSVQAALFL